MSTLLVLILILPFGSLALFWAVADAPARAVAHLALAVSLVLVALIGWLVLGYPAAPAAETAEAQVYAASEWDWVRVRPHVPARFSSPIRLSVGLDGLSLVLLAWTAMLLPTLVLLKGRTAVERPAGYFSSFVAGIRRAVVGHVCRA